jgi:hypothetical protein
MESEMKEIGPVSVDGFTAPEMSQEKWQAAMKKALRNRILPFIPCPLARLE